MKMILTSQDALYVADSVKNKNKFLYEIMIASDIESALNQIQLRIQAAAYRGLTSIEFSLVKVETLTSTSNEYSCFGLGEMLDISKTLRENGFKSSFEGLTVYGTDCFKLNVSWAPIHTPFM